MLGYLQHATPIPVAGCAGDDDFLQAAGKMFREAVLLRASRVAAEECIRD